MLETNKITPIRMLTDKTIAAVGDVSDVNCWSGIPFHFWQSARATGFATESWRVDLQQISWQRWFWNLGGIFRGGTGGFQYSTWFLELAERQIPPALMTSEAITFNQHFPRGTTVISAGGSLNHYLDAPFVALATGRGLDLRLPRRIVAEACDLERANYAASRRIVTMARWAAEVIIKECDTPATKVFTILPGANLELPEDWSFRVPDGRAGRERDFVMGFVGKDWRRKGLPLLLEVRDELARRGWRVMVRAAGNAPVELHHKQGVSFAGFIDKRTKAADFLNFLAGCDIGCLFSEREAFGISTLEFLRAGVPVVGFAHEGLADSLPPDAGFRFDIEANAMTIADKFEVYLNDEAKQHQFRKNAQQWSGVVTWARCVREFQELWAIGKVTNPVQPWRGLVDQIQ
jgi:glycosyltransferase involved in cell wall biosynthesis